MKKPLTRIQKKNHDAIMTAGLDVFSQHGFRGATLDQVAEAAGLSKPNLLYYFPSKEAIYTSLLEGLLESWLAPLNQLDPNGDPVEELIGYAKHKLSLSRDLPRESRLFAFEILRGAPEIKPFLKGDLKQQVTDQSSVINGWIAAGSINAVDPVHLLFSIWALTQHYADFEVQVRAILGENDPYTAAEAHIDMVLRRLLSPTP